MSDTGPPDHATPPPAPLTPFIGREREVADIGALVCRQDVPLVTLTGPGGIGKTRLALQIAREVGNRFTDGVVFVDLSPVRDSTLVLPTIAAALGARDTGTRSLAEVLATSLGHRQLLLILDNLEQVVSAGPGIAGMLSACPGVTVLATSRVVLRLSGEHVVQISPLRLPDVADRPSLGEQAQSEAVTLLVDRARAVDPNFTLTEANTETVTAIVRRLDGVPLAIELAAARIRAFSPTTLLARLDRRLPMLTCGMRDAPARQQTMRDAIAWSHDLLDERDQRLFRRLGIFVGGFTIDAAEAVCRDAGDDANCIWDGLTSLIDQSLLSRLDTPSREARFGMLETVREYALELLRGCGEEEATRQRHAGYLVALVEGTESGELFGRREIEWLDRCEAELGSLRAALEWSTGANGDPDLGLRLGSALWWFWHTRGGVREGQAWLQRALSRGDEVSTGSRARAMATCGFLAVVQPDYERAEH